MQRITLDQVRIFEKYSGDIDGFSRVASRSERLLMNDATWAQIDEMVSVLTMLEKGLLAPGFKKETLNRLNERTEDSSVVTAIRLLAQKAL